MVTQPMPQLFCRTVFDRIQRSWEETVSISSSAEQNFLTYFLQRWIWVVH